MNLFEIGHSLARQFGPEPWTMYKGTHLLSFLDNHDVTRIATQLTEKNHIYAAYALMFGMPGVPAVLINLSYRMQGFYVQKGNPKGITGWKDLRRGDLTILNRRLGSSPRILLDSQLMRLGIRPAEVPGYEREMKSHLTIAAAIAAKEADLALGTERISRQIDGIDFIPLQQERYDLVIRRSLLETPEGLQLLQILQSDLFRREIEQFSGNDYRDLGKIVMEV